MKRFHRPGARGRHHQADLFFADLVGEPLRPRRRLRTPAGSGWRAAGPAVPHYPVAGQTQAPATPAPLDDEFDEAVPSGGRGRFRHEPLGGEGDNVEARFNVDAATASGSTIDVVVHLHGFSMRPDDATFLTQKAAAAGVDMLGDGGAVRVRASQPTLALVPRGRHVLGPVWVFDRLRDRAALDRLIGAGLSWLCATVLRLPGGSTLTRGRLTLAAHSGGGGGVSALLAGGLDPDEVMCFDSIYGGEEPIRRWAEARIASPNASRSGLRVFYTGSSAPAAAHPAGRWLTGRNGKLTYQPPGSWIYRNGQWHLVTTEVRSRRLHEAIQRAVARATGGAALVNRFRVQQTSVAHNDIPAQYSPLLLDSIAAEVPNASRPPAASVRPVCVENDDWLTAEPRKPGGSDAPPARPGAAPGPAQTAGAAAPAAAAPAAAEDAYAPPNARPYTRNTSAAIFRTPPNPVAVAAATQWPQPATDGDAVSQRALRAAGVDSAGIAAFGSAGMTALRPIAAAFGDAALTEVLQRLRYTPAHLVRPPHSYNRDADLTRAFGRAVPRPVILAPRTLLGVPGHFRELARLAGSEDEAFALENIGWLLMQGLRSEVVTSSGTDFWLPASPSFVTPFTAGVPGLSAQTSQLISARRLTDATVDAPAYRAKFRAWQAGSPGRLWRLETGRDTSPSRPAGAPFYSDPFTIPHPINIAAERGQVQGAWRRRLAEVDSGRTQKPLTECDGAYLSSLGLIAPISLRGLQLRAKFPSPASARSLTQLNGLAAVQPAFEAAFQAIADLGWNDLLFETEGMGCFRGKKIPGNPAAARNMSEHSLGIAIDLNVFENGQNTTGSMDPRIVALFEAFRFRWGKGFSTPDPMHFEYAG
ncbi:MAG: M15 family metallopeptidase [Acidobacteriota bacterium]